MSPASVGRPQSLTEPPSEEPPEYGAWCSPRVSVAMSLYSLTSRFPSFPAVGPAVGRAGRSVGSAASAR